MSAAPEDISALYHAFNDRLDQSGKKQKLITCRTCREVGVPSHSANSDVCEMCFEDDFWDHFREKRDEKVARLWVAKAKEEFVFCDNYFPVGSYLGYDDQSVDGLGQARFFQNKSDVVSWIASSGGPFKTAEIELQETK